MFDGEKLEYVEPNILVAPFYKDERGPSRQWRREIAFDFGGGLSAHLRSPA